MKTRPVVFLTVFLTQSDSLIFNSFMKYSSPPWGVGSMNLHSNEDSGASFSSFDNIDDAIGMGVSPLPTVSSKINFGDQTPQHIDYDLWVVGAGTLGAAVAQAWKEKYPSSQVVAETKSKRRHEELIRAGVIARMREERNAEDDDMCARNVLISLPPSASVDYIAELNAACRIWAGPLGDGNLVFTSSTAVYGDSFGNIVNEIFRLDTRSLRATKMIAAEEAIISRGGCALRLAGLYNAFRGPHTFWLRNGTVDGTSSGYINLLHYEDAVSVAVAALEKGVGGSTYLACDDRVMSREEICVASLESGLFPDLQMPVAAGPQGKVCDDTLTRKALDWKPKYSTFGEYMVQEVGGKPYALPHDPFRPDVRKAADDKKAAKSLLWLPGDDEDLF